VALRLVSVRSSPRETLARESLARESLAGETIESASHAGTNRENKPGMLIRFAPWIFVLLWSTGYIGMKAAAPFAEPMTFLSLRFLLVVAILLLSLPVLRIPMLHWRDAARAAFIGAFLHGIYLGGIMYAIKHGMPAGVAALVISLQPIVTAVCSGALLGIRINGWHWAGLSIGILGAGLVLSPRLDLGGAALPVETLVAACVGLAAITFATLYQKASASHLDLRASLLPQYAGAALITGLYALAFESRVVVWNMQLGLALAWLVVGLSIGAISLLLLLLRENAAWRISTLFYLIPPVTAVIAWLLFDEQLAWIQLFGMAVVMTAVIVVRPVSRPQTE